MRFQELLTLLAWAVGWECASHSSHFCRLPHPTPPPHEPPAMWLIQCVCVFYRSPPTSFFLFLATHVPPATTNPFHTPPSPLASWLISTRYRLSVDLQMVEITACRRWCTPLPAIVLPFLFPLQCHCTQWVSLSPHTHTHTHTQLRTKLRDRTATLRRRSLLRYFPRRGLPSLCF